MAAPSNFYYYGKHDKPVSEIADLYRGLPHGPKFTTQWPTNVALIRVTVFSLFAACAAANGLTIWSWPVVIISASYALYTAYKQLLTQDPLVGVFYNIAGGKDKFIQLPEYPLPADYKKLSDVVENIEWDKLEHPVYRALTDDGRKVMIIKGLNEVKGIFAPIQTRAVMAFVEKLGPYDVPRGFLDERVESFFFAMAFMLENPYAIELSPPEGRGKGDTRHSTNISGSIPYDMVGEFRDQLGHVNRVGPSIEDVD